LRAPPGATATSTTVGLDGQVEAPEQRGTTAGDDGAVGEPEHDGADLGQEAEVQQAVTQQVRPAKRQRPIRVDPAADPADGFAVEPVAEVRLRDTQSCQLTDIRQPLSRVGKRQIHVHAARL
jgi:hypothetical protein